MLPHSQRAQRVQAPVIPIVGEWVKQYPGTISLGQGVVFYPPPETVHQGLASFWKDPSNHKYKLVQGIPELVAAFQEKLERENGIPPIPSQSFVVTAGSNLAFSNAIFALCDPGDEVILPTPYYFNHEMAIQVANAVPVLVPTTPQYQLDLPALEKAITSKTRAIVTISPNNPTGAIYPESDVRWVNELCRNHGLMHISDEAYEYFTYDHHTHFSPGSLPGAAPHTLSLFSLSKAYGFAGWRIGGMLLPNSLLESVRKIQDTQLICAAVPTQFAAVEALRTGKSYALQHLPTLTQVRSELIAALQKIPELLPLPPSQGAFYLLLKIPINIPSLNLVEYLIREHRIAVIPGSAFGLDQDCRIRVAFGALDLATSRIGISRLVKGLQDALSHFP